MKTKFKPISVKNPIQLLINNGFTLSDEQKNNLPMLTLEMALLKKQSPFLIANKMNADEYFRLVLKELSDVICSDEIHGYDFPSCGENFETSIYRKILQCLYSIYNKIGFNKSDYFNDVMLLCNYYDVMTLNDNEKLNPDTVNAMKYLILQFALEIGGIEAIAFNTRKCFSGGEHETELFYIQTDIIENNKGYFLINKAYPEQGLLIYQCGWGYQPMTEKNRNILFHPCKNLAMQFLFDELKYDDFYNVVTPKM